MTKEKSTKPESIMDDPKFNPFISGDDEVIEQHLEASYEIIDNLIELTKKDKVLVKITHNKAKDTWKGEMIFKASGNIAYFTDIPVDVQVLMNKVLDSGLTPEYVEE